MPAFNNAISGLPKQRTSESSQKHIHDLPSTVLQRLLLMKAWTVSCSSRTGLFVVVDTVVRAARTNLPEASPLWISLCVCPSTLPWGRNQVMVFQEDFLSDQTVKYTAIAVLGDLHGRFACFANIMVQTHLREWRVDVGMLFHWHWMSQEPTTRAVGMIAGYNVEQLFGQNTDHRHWSGSVLR